MNPHDHDDRIAYTFAPLIFATMLFVCEHVLGYPNREDVFAQIPGSLGKRIS